MAAVDPRGVGWAIRKFGRWHADILDPTAMMVRDEVEGHFQESCRRQDASGTCAVLFRWWAKPAFG